MKCIRCSHDSKLKERPNRTCPKCKRRFAFEPREGDPFTDQFFKNAIDAVSGNGRIKWGVEHLYYEVNRRKRGKILPLHVSIPLFVAGVLFLAAFLSSIGTRPGFPWVPFGFPFGLPIGAALLFVSGRSLLASSFVRISASEFARHWDRWCEAHGTPPSVIKRSPEIQERHRASAAMATAEAYPVPPRQTNDAGGTTPTFGKRGAVTTQGPAPAPSFGKRGTVDAPLEADVADYSFDRAVICDRARTADLLIANNFHFENNCAILSIDGYPENVFETVKAMIRRNPRIHVFTLHDATAEGCRLAQRVAFAPRWFAGKVLVVDLGLRPRHAKTFAGLLLPATAGNIIGGHGVDAAEAKWLSEHTLELAAVRPEDVLKRLFRGIQAHDKDDTSGGGTSNCGSFDSHSGSSGDSADGADSFG